MAAVDSNPLSFNGILLVKEGGMLQAVQFQCCSDSLQAAARVAYVHWSGVRILEERCKYNVSKPRAQNITFIVQIWSSSFGVRDKRARLRFQL